MSLIEKIETEIKNCKAVIAECDNAINQQKIKKECYIDALEMLQEILENAKSESADATNTNDISSVKTLRKRKSTNTAATNTSEPISDNTSGITIKALAEKLEKSVVDIANACNATNINESIAKNNNLITPENVEIIKNYFISISS